MLIQRVTGVATPAKFLEGLLAFPLATCAVKFIHYKLSYPLERKGRCLYQQCILFAS